MGNVLDLCSRFERDGHNKSQQTLCPGYVCNLNNKTYIISAEWRNYKGPAHLILFARSRSTNILQYVSKCSRWIMYSWIGVIFLKVRTVGLEYVSSLVRFSLWDFLRHSIPRLEDENTPNWLYQPVCYLGMNFQTNTSNSYLARRSDNEENAIWQVDFWYRPVIPNRI